ncbi:FAD:protein FMN transferase [Lacticaseibacillus saniviri]|uniref:FAD:protein FMN transferase n=1 Tax=Lacticaseibacillus saniviri JCM 17471 = DSM 24301 TaxID=1293598 RepID=A0A0R2MX20_9LACO|nr:FAD:protein FMN transferase [Lacticaseibacillus saniviri]KRO18038.1 thiamine biosynthesis lipoprotein [Lacticaseibacillus saniviri JCM 17471 = DSM 24301]MCG4281482.1 FAD:protein FMN transferase [Lacticaseibacillus saniviri]
MKRIGLLFLPLLLVIGLVGCQQKQATPKPEMVSQPYQDTQFLMGTVVTLRVYDKGKQDALNTAFARIKQLANEITVNEKGSEVDEVNKQAGIKPVKVTPSVYKLISYAKYFSDNSDGSFDLAIGPITALWHIGFPDAKKPTQQEIDERLPLVNYKDVTLDATKQTVYLKRKNMALDLGGIAKGFITDEVVKTLKKSGVTTAIVDLGGNLYVLGNSPKHKNAKWNVGIQDPKSSRGTALGTVPEVNKTIVTSGIYERYLKVNGKIYMHLMNPKTGYPFDNNLMGVSIITKKSVDGDALSTATFDKGLKDGMTYIEKKKDTEAVFITKDKKVYITSGLKNKFKLVSGSGYKMATLN